MRSTGNCKGHLSVVLGNLFTKCELFLVYLRIYSSYAQETPEQTIFFLDFASPSTTLHFRFRMRHIMRVHMSMSTTWMGVGCSVHIVVSRTVQETKNVTRRSNKL